MREEVREIMEEIERGAPGVIKVIAVPDGDGDGHGEKVVSFAVWQFVNESTDEFDGGFDGSASNLRASIAAQHLWSIFPSPPANTDSNTNQDPDSNPSNPPFNCTPHHDTNLTRLHSIQSQESAAISTYLTPSYPTRLYLALLATHPDYDGHGYAAAQVRLGLAWAVKHGLPVTLLATPAGYPVYKGVEFQGVQNVTIGFFDGLGEEWEEVMVWESGMEERSGEVDFGW